jgi:general secretion pathway protein K
LYGALLDWLDENDASNANGFESGDYQSKRTPYFAADQKLTSMGELRYVEGFTAEIIKKLKPFVTILPIEGAKININTTTLEVLASLSSGSVSDTSSAAGFLAEREQPGFQGFQPNRITDAEGAIIGGSVVSAQPVPNMMQVNSQFFQINTKVSLGDYAVCMQSVVLRESATEEAATTPKVSVLSRQHNTLCEVESTSQDTTINNSDEDLR